MVLTGSEVKSLRSNKVSIEEAYICELEGELWLQNAYIATYSEANRLNHDTHRLRKLLLHKKEINKIIGSLIKNGMTLIPLTLYFNKKNLAKLSIAIAKGKKLHDKRQTIKDRDWQREKARIHKQNNI